MPTKTKFYIRQHFNHRLTQAVDITGVVAQRKKEKERKADYMRQYRQQYRHKRAYLTLDENLYRSWQQKAHKQGCSLAQFIRNCAEAYLNKKYLVPRNIAQQLQQLVLELRQMGNNLNQIARQVNTRQQTTTEDLQGAHAVLAQVEDLIVNFIQNPADLKIKNKADDNTLDE